MLSEREEARENRDGRDLFDRLPFGLGRQDGHEHVQDLLRHGTAFSLKGMSMSSRSRRSAGRLPGPERRDAPFAGIGGGAAPRERTDARQSESGSWSLEVERSARGSTGDWVGEGRLKRAPAPDRLDASAQGPGVERRDVGGWRHFLVGR